MATRAQVKTWIRNFLGTGADDPLYGDTAAGVSPLLDPIVQQSVDALVAEIQETNRGYLTKTAVLAADTPTTGRLYSLATQPAQILDFSHWLELRYTDENGAEFDEVRVEELPHVGSDFFALTGPDDAPTIQTSIDTAAAVPLWLRYGYWPADLANDAAVIPAIPKRYHDLVALEALFAFEIGGESVRPRALEQRWQHRRALLFQHIARRGVRPQRTRLQRAAYL